MDSPWQEVALGDLIRVEHGWPFVGDLCSETLTGRPIVINIGNFRYTGGFRFDETTTREYRGEYPPQFELRPGDILLVMTCQTAGGEILGIPARVPDDGRVYLHNQRMGKVVIVRRDRVRDDYLYWLFHWRAFNGELVASSTGTKILHTAPSRIGAFRFLLPSLDEQAAIAGTLDVLDNKLELNRQMSRVLHALAGAIFKSWFVDFDPVTAKANGSEPVGALAEVAGVWPSRFEDFPAGPIPSGWRAGSIVSLARYVNGRNFTKGATGRGRIVIRIAELNSGPGPSTAYTDEDAPPEHIARAGDLLFAWSGSLGIYRWMRDEGLINQHIFKVISDVFPQWFVYFHLLEAMAFFQGIAADKATTMGHIRREHLSQWDVAIPPPRILDAADSRIGPLYEMVLGNEREAQMLAGLRDMLVPRLLSGDITIREAEKVVERAGA